MATKKGTTKRTAKQDRHQQQAARLIRLYFSPDTPALVRDVLSTLFSQLENEVQVFYMRPALETLLPLMLAEAERIGLDLEDLSSPLVAETLSHTLAINTTSDEDDRPPVNETLAEIEADARAFARIINSPRVPSDVRVRVGEAFDDCAGSFGNTPEVVTAQWTLAAMKYAAQQKGGAE